MDRATFDELWPESEGRRIEKERQRMDLGGGLLAELDTYGGELAGVAVVEVEFPSTAGARAFRPPAWFGREVTGDRAWANQSLATAGLPDRKGEFRLRAGELPVPGVSRVISARAAQAAAAVRRASAADDPARDVHEARKSLKKARSALRLLRGVITEEEREAANAACRDAAGQLAGARDAEVKLATLELVTAGDSSPVVAEYREQLEREAAARREVLTPEGLAGVSELIEGVRERYRERNLPAAAGAVVANLGRGYRRGRQNMKKARAGGEAEQFHDWRKRAKDLRYQLEILEPRLPENFSEMRARAETLAEKLGDLHDLDVLADDLGGRGFNPGQQQHLAGLLSDFRLILAESCLELGALTYRPGPRRFVKKLDSALGQPGGSPR